MFLSVSVQINDDFNDLMANWQNIQFEPLDPDPNEKGFNNVMTSFREFVDVLEHKLAFQFNLAFDDCYSLDQATKVCYTTKI